MRTLRLSHRTAWLAIFFLFSLAFVFYIPVHASRGQNAKTNEAEATASSVGSGGSWSPLLNTRDVPVHISLLPDGRILYWARDKKQDTGWDVGNGSNTYVVDPLYLDNPNYTKLITNMTTNLFCSGHSFLPDGRLLVTGGHGKVQIPDPDHPGQLMDDPAYDFAEGIGEKDINVFDYAHNTWTLLPAQMERGRWYPFNVTLANGETLIMSGSYWDGTYTTGSQSVPNTPANTEPTVFDLQGGIRTLHQGNDPKYDNIRTYPYLSLTPANKVFSAKPSISVDDPFLTNHLFDPYAPNPLTQGQGVFTTITKPTHLHWEGTSAMYAPGKVLLTGGSTVSTSAGNQSALTETIDLTRPFPQWNADFQAKPMAVGRQFPVATLLPDGKVLVTGGTRCFGFNRLDCGENHTYGGAVQTPELWDPEHSLDNWVAMNATASGEPRVYHSIAMLMPDARVLVGGGGLPVAIFETVPGPFGNPTLCTGTSPQTSAIECRNSGHKNVEFFSPPYLYNANGTEAIRPAIASAPDNIAYGQQFSIDVGNVDRATIAKVVLIRLPSVTHTYNQDQRRVDLGVPASDPNTSTVINITAPASGVECPPGPYMMFLISNNGRNTPSIAKIVRVGDYSIDRTLQDFTADGDRGAIIVNVASGVNWTATSDSAWLNITSMTASPVGRITFTVAPNPGGARTGKITVKVPGRAGDTGIEFKVNQAGTFADVPTSHPLYRFIEKIYAHQLTAGCGGGNFCPDLTISRQETAVFLSVLMTNVGNLPNSISTGYADVNNSNPFSKFITYVGKRGIPGVADSCAPGNFCPTQAMTRKDMVVWLLRAHGINNPPPATQSFNDVPLNDPAAPYISEAVRRGITAGCGNGNFCPNQPVTRGEMAVFIVQTFGL
ncbi:MAG: galactose oxidase-like domain-containing protein [Blastocatellia bacterium]